VSTRSEEFEKAEEYFRGWEAWLRAASAAGTLRKPDWRALQPAPPIAAIKVAALEHPNARVRRDCLNVLDHYANDDSVDVFRLALNDPVPRVRTIALHGLACERCRSEELCATDVVPTLAGVLERDPSAKVRHDTIGILLRLSTRDPRATAAIRSAATEDADPLVRQVALAALDGRTRDIRSRKALRRRATRADQRAI
jgi:HEAT repeat protein